MVNIPKDFDVTKECNYIASCLDEYSYARETISLLRANSALQNLRAIYRKDSRLFTSHIECLKELAARIHKELIQLEYELAPRYKELISKRQAINTACDIYRQALIELCKVHDYESMRLADGVVSAKQTELINMPRRYTSEHEQLLDILQEKGYWEEIAIPSIALLKKAINSGIISAEDVEIIRALCFIKKTYRITVTPTSSHIKNAEAWGIVAAGIFYSPDEDVDLKSKSDSMLENQEYEDKANFECISIYDESYEDEETDEDESDEVEVGDEDEETDEDEDDPYSGYRDDEYYEDDSENLYEDLDDDSDDWARSEGDGWFYD